VRKRDRIDLVPLPRVGLAGRSSNQQQDADHKNNAPQHGTGPEISPKSMMTLRRDIKTAAVHNRAFRIDLNQRHDRKRCSTAGPPL
jgi:hypothetical protein